MYNYVASLLCQRDRRAESHLTFELKDAIDEKKSRGGRLSKRERLVWQLCTVSTCDGIAGVLDAQPECVESAALFALECGLIETGAILTNAVKGIPVPGAVLVGGVDLPHCKWGATDLTLSFLNESLDDAILDFVDEYVDDFDLDPPSYVTREKKIAAQIAKTAKKTTASELFCELLGHKMPRMRASLQWDDKDLREFPVRHLPNPEMSDVKFAKLSKEHGPAAASLLEVYRVHDGADLFVVNRKPGFRLIPSRDWPAHMGRVMEWARDVTWAEEPDDLPDYLASAIPFGHIDGDSERWILVTSGKHAGKVMLSNTDVIDDDPRYKSIEEFFAILIRHTARIVGVGGYIDYTTKDLGPFYPYLPEKYLFESGSATKEGRSR